MRLFFVVIIISAFSSCMEKTNRKLINITDKFKQQVPKDTSVRYFPVESLSLTDNNKREADYYLKKWAFETLFYLREPVLYNYSGEGESIRLTWLRTFDNPVIIRLNNFNDTVYANIKELKSKYSENDIPKIIRDTIVAIDTKKWQEMLLALQKNNYWNAIYKDTSSEGKDGTTWFLECRLHNKYHCINRWDDGRFSSKDLNLYAKELINIVDGIIQIKSTRY